MKKFLTKIKIQASKCEFDNLLDEMLKDKIVFGIRSNQIRQKLLTEDKLELTKETSKQVHKFESKSKIDKVIVVKNKSARNKQDKNFDCRRY